MQIRPAHTASNAVVNGPRIAVVASAGPMGGAIAGGGVEGSCASRSTVPSMSSGPRVAIAVAVDTRALSADDEDLAVAGDPDRVEVCLKARVHLVVPDAVDLVRDEGAACGPQPVARTGEGLDAVGASVPCRVPRDAVVVEQIAGRRGIDVAAARAPDRDDRVLGPAVDRPPAVTVPVEQQALLAAGPHILGRASPHGIHPPDGQPIFAAEHLRIEAPPGCRGRGATDQRQHGHQADHAGVTRDGNDCFRYNQA